MGSKKEIECLKPIVAQRAAEYVAKLLEFHRSSFTNLTESELINCIMMDMTHACEQFCLPKGSEMDGSRDFLITDSEAFELMQLWHKEAMRELSRNTSGLFTAIKHPTPRFQIKAFAPNIPWTFYAPRPATFTPLLCPLL